MTSFTVPAVARAGSGVCYAYFEQAEDVTGWFTRNRPRGWKAVIEFSPEQHKQTLDLWPSPGGDFELMGRVKALFDPSNLLNRGRLYRRI